MASSEQAVKYEQKQELSLNNIEKSVERLQNNLEEFGLTPNQSKVYAFLGKYGTKTATEVNRALKLPRTETYQILSSLQSKGIVSAMFEHPVKFTAVEITNAIAAIIDVEKNKIKKLEKQKIELVELWNKIPIGVDEKTIDEKFQILQGENQINSKVNDMVNNASKELIIIGNERDFTKFYHAGILEKISKSSNCKILTTSTEKTMHVFDDIENKNIRKLSSKIRDSLCFIIKDEEVLFYMKNESKKETTAMWTNSNAMKYSKKLLFEELWKKSEGIKN